MSVKPEIAWRIICPACRKYAIAKTREECVTRFNEHLEDKHPLLNTSVKPVQFEDYFKPVQKMD
jgi:hypothetical protein